MELSRVPSGKNQKRTGLGRCRHFFWLGVVFDTTGVLLMFAGVFAHVVYYDLLLFGGSIIVFFSLLWWVFWYTGNIELSAEEDPAREPPANVLNILGLATRPRFSLTLDSLSAFFMRMQRRWLQKQRSSRSVSAQDQVEDTRWDEEAGEGLQASGGTPGFSPEGQRTRLTFLTTKPPASASQTSTGQFLQAILSPLNLFSAPMSSQSVVTLAPGSRDDIPVSSQDQFPVSVIVQGQPQDPAPHPPESTPESF